MSTGWRRPRRNPTPPDEPVDRAAQASQWVARQPTIASSEGDKLGVNSRRWRSNDSLPLFDGHPLPGGEDDGAGIVAIASDNRARIRHLLVQLPPRERAVLELRATELSTREIADVLQISEQNVRTAQSRAVARLRGLLAAPGIAVPEMDDA
jgi:RNA polymerase sigma factor (sigma-70 family)